VIGGNISNETSPKIVVVIDVVGTVVTEEVNKGFLRKEQIQKVKTIDLKNVSQLWNLGNKYGLSIELAAFASDGWTQETLEEVMEKLERRVSNPFNYAEVYADIEELISVLPYRANLKGVVDVQERVARYGSYGVELNNL
jgi:hypothetical protein